MKELKSFHINIQINSLVFGILSKYCKAAGIYLSKFNNGNSRTMCEIYSKLKIKQDINYPWETMYNVIFLISSNFPIVSTVVWETEIKYFEKWKVCNVFLSR